MDKMADFLEPKESLCPCSTSLSKALNLHLSLIGLSQVSVSSLTYFIVQTEPKILRLVGL